MSKLGISIKIDVTKLDKSKFYKGKKGTYVTLKTFIAPKDFDQYGNNGFVTQDIDGVDRPPILGNCKVFHDSESAAAHREGIENARDSIEDEDDLVPF